MRTVTITTETGTVQYQLVNGSALPAIKAGHLTFETRSGVQSIPAGAVLDFTIEAGRAGSKSDRLKAELAASLAHLDELRAQVHEAANASTAPEDATFTDALEAYAEAVEEHNERQEKTQRFIERRAKTLAKREAKAPKAALAPVPSPASFTPDEPVATPTPKARKAAKK